jgi:hypothetical protein
MSTQYRLVQSGKTASGSCSAGQGSSEPVAPRIFNHCSHRLMLAHSFVKISWLIQKLFLTEQGKSSKYVNFSFQAELLLGRGCYGDGWKSDKLSVAELYDETDSSHLARGLTALPHFLV